MRISIVFVSIEEQIAIEEFVAFMWRYVLSLIKEAAQNRVLKVFALWPQEKGGEWHLMKTDLPLGKYNVADQPTIDRIKIPQPKGVKVEKLMEYIYFRLEPMLLTYTMLSPDADAYVEFRQTTPDLKNDSLIYLSNSV